MMIRIGVMIMPRTPKILRPKYSAAIVTMGESPSCPATSFGSITCRITVIAA